MEISVATTGGLAAPPEPRPAAGARFVLLGPLEIQDGHRVRTPRAHKPRVLLAILLVRAGTVVSTDTLISELWGDHPPRTALKALRVYVSQLRRVLAALPGAPVTATGPGSSAGAGTGPLHGGGHGSHHTGGDGAGAALRPVIVTRDPGYRLDLPPESLDLRQFERLCSLGRAARDAGDLPGALGRYREATALWKGPALGDVRSSLLLDGVALRLEESRVTALERRLELEIRLGGHSEVISELRQLAAEYPLRERIHYQLMVALSLAGRRGDALQTFRELRGTFVSELGVEPSPDLQRLHQSLLSADRSAVPSPEFWER